MERKTCKAADRLFDIAWIIFLIAQLICCTSAYDQWDSAIRPLAYKGAFALSCVLCLAVIIVNLVQKVYPLRMIFFYLILGIVFILSFRFCRNSLILWSFALLGAVYEQNGNRVMEIAAILAGAFLVVTVAASQVGLISDVLFTVGGRPRHSLGYVWVTNAPTIFFFFLLAYVYIRRELTKAWELLILAGANVYLYLLTDTRMPFFLGMAFIIFILIENCFRNHFRVLKHLNWLYVALPAIICIGTLALYYFYNRDTEWMVRLNGLLSGRLELGRNAIATYGFSLFGQKIEWIGSLATDVTTNPNYNYVDCSFLRILLNNGAVFLAGIIVIYTRMALRAGKAKNFYLSFIMIAVLLYGFSDPRLFEMSYNFIPLLAFADVSRPAARYVTVRKM